MGQADGGKCERRILLHKACYPVHEGYAPRQHHQSVVYIWLIGAGDFPPYHASKGAVRLMTKNDALLYATDNIRVNSVHPGFIWTPMVENVAKQSDLGIKEFRTVIDTKHPLGHIGEPNDVAWGIVYLASEEAKFVTGAELVIDGGYTAQ